MRHSTSLVPSMLVLAASLCLTGPSASAAPAAKEMFNGEFKQFSVGNENKTSVGSATSGSGGGKAKFNQFTIKVAADTLTWSVKGKAAHTIKYEIVKGNDPNSLTLRFIKDGNKDLKGQIVPVTFSDDNTFNMKDPFASDPTKATTLVFKRQ